MTASLNNNNFALKVKEIGLPPKFAEFIATETQFITDIPSLRHGLLLENGQRLLNVCVALRTFGTLRASKGQAILVCHALTGSADVDRWWSGLLGAHKILDPTKYFIVCMNVLGSCYGTTGPVSRKPPTNGEAPTTACPYGAAFPTITIRDMVQLQALVATHLGIERFKMIIGGSLGGMQALEWAVMYPERLESLVVMATSLRHSPWCIGLSEVQRQAIYDDPDWQNGYYLSEQPPLKGLALARMLAMCTYRSAKSFARRFGRRQQSSQLPGMFAIESYLQYHGQKLAARFDPHSYITLTKAMDTHDLKRQRKGTYKEILGQIWQPTLIISTPTDILYPPSEQRTLARLIPKAHLQELPSLHGHDAFLLETQRLNRLLLAFQATLKNG